MASQRLLLTITALGLASCEAVPARPGGTAPPPVAEAPAPLSDCASLVPIFAEDTAQGLAREAACLDANRPGAAFVSRSQDRCGDTPVHRVAYVADGVAGVVVFDITSYYGRVDGDDLNDLLDG